MNAEKNSAKRAVIYCRVSTKEQVEEGNSLTTQEKLCREYSVKNGYEIVEVFIEQGESAKTANRTELKRLLAFCRDRKNKVSIAIAYKIDRISRNTDDYSKIRLELRAYGIEIKSTSEHFESSPVGRFLENTMASIAQFDNDIRTERSVGGMREAVQEGRYVWMAPIGYDNVKIGGKSTIAVNATMGPFIRKAFQLVASNTQPIDEVRASMVKEGFVHTTGKSFCRSYFYYLLTNKLYTGWIYKFGEKHRGTFEPLVTEELFEQVQRVLKHKGTKHIQHITDNPDFPLRRFVLNPFGKKLTGSWSKGRTKKYPFYHFVGKGCCYSKSVFEAGFLKFMDESGFNEADFKELEAVIRKRFTKRTYNEQQEVERLKKYTVHLLEKQSALIDKNMQGIISNVILTRELERIEQELLDTNAKIANSPIETKGGINIEDALTYLKEYIKTPSKIWLTSGIDRKIKLQWFQFPQGVLFDGEKFRTKEISNFFKVKKQFLPHLSKVVPSGLRISNQETISHNDIWENWKREAIIAYKLIADTS